MKTLGDAWAWYKAVATNAKRLTHLAEHWDQLPWATAEYEWVKKLERDNVLGRVDSGEMREDARRAAKELDELAVLVLFSVFEAIVRDWVEEQVRPEIEQLRHPTLVKAGREVLDAVAQGSFFRLLEPYKLTGNHDLVEQINQIRKYRNWVAHGRNPQNAPATSVTPLDARDRLQQFLDLLQQSGALSSVPPPGAP